MKYPWLIVGLILTLTLAACAAPGTAPKVTFTPCPTSVASAASACVLPSRTPPPLPSGALFQVLLSDGKTAAFSAADLQKLPAVKATLDGKAEEGVRLLDVLSAAGVKDFTEIILNGTTTASIKKAQLDEQAVLTTSGTVQLIAAGLNAEQQVKGVTTIRIK